MGDETKTKRRSLRTCAQGLLDQTLELIRDVLVDAARASKATRTKSAALDNHSRARR